MTKWEGIANNKRIVKIDEEENREENETGFDQNCIQFKLASIFSLEEYLIN